jgi:hypothetical protein
MYVAPMSCYGLSMLPRTLVLLLLTVSLLTTPFACNDGRDDPLVCGQATQDLYDPCASDDHCLYGQCSNGYCSPECTVSEDCAEALEGCEDGVCVLSCTEQFPCPSDLGLDCVAQVGSVLGICRADRACE